MTQYTVIDAPSKWQLHLGFFDRLSDGERRQVVFVLRAENKKVLNIFVVINSLEWEDGSGESWDFKGYIGKPFENENGQSVPSGTVEGWFSTKDRKGWIKVSA